MNEPIRPRPHIRGGQYAVWVKGHQREPESHTYEWVHWRASPRHAAQAFCEDLVDYGRHPELVGKPLEVLVRDKVDGSLTSFTIAWEQDPAPYVSGQETIEGRAGEVLYG